MPLPLADMDKALEAAGIPFLEVGWQPMDPTGADDWRSRGRPASTGPFNPEGVLCHHTASPSGTTPANDIAVILAGNGDAPGPISQLYIGRDAQVYLVAAGRANHGGRGIRPGIDSGCADMNALLVGIEVGNNGVGEYWGDEQTDIYARVVSALCAWYGWSVEQVYLHATTGPPSGGCNSKIDPAGPWQGEPELNGQTWNLDTWRQFVNDRSATGGGNEDEMTDTDWERMQGLIHETVLGIVRSEEYMNIVKVKATEADRDAMVTNQEVRDTLQAEAFEAGLGIMRSEEFALIIRANS